MTAIAVDRPRRPLLAVRLLRMEVRHSAFIWAIPLLVVLFIYDPYRTAFGYPPLWTLRASVVLNKFWPDVVPFAAGFAAWAGSRDGRRNIGDLLGTTARPAWTRQLCSLAGTVAWVLAAFLVGVIALYVKTASQATWGGPPIWPVVVGVVALTAVCALAFTLGALFPGRFTAPIVAVGMVVVMLVAFHRAVVEGGSSVYVLSPDTVVPPNGTGLFYPVAPDLSIVQVMFFAGATLGSIGLLGLSPRTGGVGWRGALSAVSGGGARLRTVATAVFAAGVALAVTGVGLAGTAQGSLISGTRISAVHDSASDQPIPYTPVCAGTSIQVCLHPAYKGYLAQAVSSLDPVAAELAGLPGVPVRATEVPDQSLPPDVMAGNASGVVAGTPPVYQFTMDNAVTLVPNATQFRDGFRQDIAHAVIVGALGKDVTLPDGSSGFQPNLGTPAQQAVVDGLLLAISSRPYPVGGPGGNATAEQLFRRQQAQVIAAAKKFAALPAAARHAWLVANLAALKAGKITLAQLP